MKPFIVFLFLLFAVPALPVRAQNQQVVPFTLADRDRIVRTEMKLEALEIKMDAKFDAINAKFDAINGKFEAVNGRFDALESKMNTQFEVVFWTLGIMVALILFILGYTIWDRRTALRPALDMARLAEERSSLAAEKSSKAITILRELAQKYPEIDEKLKMHGLL